MRPGPTSLFTVDGDRLTPTDLVRGPWDHGLQHGGAVCGALGWASTVAVDQTENSSEFVLSRLTTEIMRPVPAVPLRYRTKVERAGRRSRVISASLWHDQVCVAKSSSQWVRVRAAGGSTSVNAAGNGTGLAGALTDSFADPAVPLRPPGATDPGAGDFSYPRPGFNCDVFELRCLLSSTEDPGPGIIWARMKTELVAGSKPNPVHLLATASDLGNAVGWEPSLADEPMVNPDVTLQLFRYPRAEWVCLESRSRSTSAGIGMMETKLWDGDGQFGRVLSTTMESTMPLSADPPGAPSKEIAE